MAGVAVSGPPGGDISCRHGGYLADALARGNFRARGAPAVVRGWYRPLALQWSARLDGSLSLGGPRPGRFRATSRHRAGDNDAVDCICSGTSDGAPAD